MNKFQKVNSNSHLSGVIRSLPEDFQVNELQQFTPCGEGEHVWLHIEKTGENTDWVAGQLAKLANVPRRDVSYAGMKDRHAVTTQWFSIQMPGQDAPYWQESLPESIKVLDEKRHNKKLRRGALQGNQFQLMIRDFQGNEDELKAAVEQITKQGIPNYFGEQRFGYKASNIEKAEQWFKEGYRIKDRAKRSIYLSAARSWIFNHILSERINDGSWNKAIEGDVFMLNGSKSCFQESIDDTIKQRVSQLDLHPTGALWGRGRVLTQSAIAELENKQAEVFSMLCQGLEKHGLKQERRALRFAVKNLDYKLIESDVLRLSFFLPAGTYATSVLAEIGEFKTI